MPLFVKHLTPAPAVQLANLGNRGKPCSLGRDVVVVSGENAVSVRRAKASIFSGCRPMQRGRSSSLKTKCVPFAARLSPPWHSLRACHPPSSRRRPSGRKGVGGRRVSGVGRLCGRTEEHGGGDLVHQGRGFRRSRHSDFSAHRHNLSLTFTSGSINVGGHSIHTGGPP